jgi:hypothetical protein
VKQEALTMHTRECALMDASRASKKSADMKVTVTGTVTGDTITVGAVALEP